MKIIYLPFLALFSLQSHATILDCDFKGEDRSISQLLAPIFPFENCQKTVDDKGDIVGYKLIKNSAYIDISYEDRSFTHEEHFLVKGKKLTVQELFLSIYTPQSKPENKYIEAQKKNILKSAYSGITYDEHGVYFFDLEVKDSAYKNYISYIKKGNPNEFIGIGTNGSKNLLIKIMFNKGMNDV
ncbi:hypothetical protein [Pseudoalteromonas sp. L1]|uniref:hypothetical protein n=1 Tax=Pseudoalteromonas sp. L1 TaxID=195716 RepID=UPI001F1C360A|nr:hypothetical protein [Pseudoalteromonas sp. L1]